MTHRDVCIYYESLKSFQESEVTLPIKANYCLYKNLRLLESEYNVFLQTRQRLADKYKEFDEDKGEYVISVKNSYSANQELEAFLQEESDVVLATFKIDLLEDISLSQKDFAKIAFLIEE